MAPPQKNEPVKQDEQEKPAPKKSGMTIIFIMIMAVTAIVLAEMLIGYFLLPSPEKVNADVEETIKKSVQKAGEIPYKATVLDTIRGEEQLEITLGEAFNITEGDVTSTPFRLSISFSVLVNKTDAEEYKKRYETSKSRIRNAVLVILRSSKQTEITDPSLGLIRNKILVKINEILGAPLVKGILYTDIALQTGI